MLKDSKADSLYYFDITEAGKGELEEGAQYGILFSTKANAASKDLIEPNDEGFQTSDLYFDTTYLGTTYTVVEPAKKGETTRENTANSQKITYAASNNGKNMSMKKVTSLCEYLDGMDAGNAPKSLEMANRLQEYLSNPVNEPAFVWSKIQPILPRYGTTSQEVYDMYVEKYKEYLEQVTNNNPYGVPIGEGNWAGSGAVVTFGTTATFANLYFPDIIDKKYAYNAAAFMFGCHPYHNYSLVAAVGAARPKQVFYGNNRADFSFIPGNVAPGLLFRKPDHFENFDDWPFLWGQNEGTIAGNTSYYIFGEAFKQMAAK